jgi:Beta-mannanase
MKFKNKRLFTSSKYQLIGFITLCFSRVLLAQTGTMVTSVEAEDGVLAGGVTKSTAIAGYSGTGYVTNFKDSPDMVTVIVNVPSTAFYSIFIRYNGADDKYQDILVNNAGASSVYFPKTNGWAITDAGKYFLHAGNDTITLRKSWGWDDIDQFLVYTTVLNSYDKIAQDPVDTNAMAATRSLYNFLLANYGKRIISGQTDGYTDQIISLTGKVPMLKVSDFQHYTDGYSYKGGSFGWDGNGTTEAIINWYNSTGKKGIVGFQWHWHSPSGGTVNTNTFYTQYTTFDVTKAVQKGTVEYSQTIRDIDSIATQLKKLQNAGVPILWRPLHEAGGGWFWWGAKGPVACKQLYAILFDRLTNYHQIHNLIWVWSTYETDWYPGNKTVDIVGMDSYPGNYNYSTQKNTFDRYFNLTNGEKIITMSENGPIPNPDDCLNYDAPWSYFMSWYDLAFSQNSNTHIKDVFANPRVITQENDTFPMIIRTTGGSVCTSGSVTLQATSNFGTIRWFANPTGGDTLHTGTNFTTPVLSSSTDYFVEASYNQAPSIMKRIKITAKVMNNVPTDTSKITGITSLCQGNNAISYSVQGSSDVERYDWILPAGATIAGLSNTNSIHVNFGAKAQSGNIFVMRHNACGDGYKDSIAIAVNMSPAAAGKISGASSVCKLTTQTYKIPSITGATSYIWTLPTGALGTSTSDTISVNFMSTSLSGTIKVKGSSACGVGSESSMAVTVNSAPSNAGIISGSDSVCKNANNVTYRVPSISGAASYIWTLPKGIIGNSSSSSILVNYSDSAVSGTIKVKGHNNCGYGSESTLPLIINDVPAAPVIVQVNNQLQSSSTVGNQWYYASFKISGAIDNTLIPKQIGNYYSIVTINGCPSLPSNIISYILSGISTIDVLDRIRLSPNPTTGNTMIFLNGNFVSDFTVEIYNTNGVLLHTIKINQPVNPVNVDLSKLPRGVYLISIYNRNKLYNTKIIKQ